MSGIYIHGIETPKNCHSCPMCLMRFCQAGDMELSEQEARPNAKRPEDCPLVPVPEHGDLIDKSGVEVLSWMEDPEKDFADGVLFVLDKLDELPVIIPADGEDYEVPADKEWKG